MRNHGNQEACGAAFFLSPVTVLIDDQFGECSLEHVERCTHDPFETIAAIATILREAKDSMLGKNGGLCPFPVVGWLKNVVAQKTSLNNQQANGDTW